MVEGREIRLSDRDRQLAADRSSPRSTEHADERARIARLPLALAPKILWTIHAAALAINLVAWTWSA